MLLLPRVSALGGRRPGTNVARLPRRPQIDGVSTPASVGHGLRGL